MFCFTRQSSKTAQDYNIIRFELNLRYGTLRQGLPFRRKNRFFNVLCKWYVIKPPVVLKFLSGKIIHHVLYHPQFSERTHASKRIVHSNISLVNFGLPFLLITAKFS